MGGGGRFGHYARVTNYEVVIRRGDGDPIRVALQSHDADQAEALYREIRAAIEEGQQVNAPAVELSAFGSAAPDQAVDPVEVTRIDLVDADQDPSPGQYGPSADYGDD